MLCKCCKNLREAKLKFFTKGKVHQANVTGLTFFSDGFAVVSLENDSSGVTQLKVAESVTCGSNEHGTALAELVQRHNLQNSATVAVLARASYSLLQVDKPEVPANEVKDAIRWQIKDLLDFPADEAVIDVFDGGGATGHPIVFAVAAAEQKVRYVVDAMLGAGLDIKAIDIPELSLRNILAKTEENARGVALLSLWQDSGLITIVRDGKLCMARRISIGVNSLLAGADAIAVEGVDISEPQQEILDDVVLEIQRSLDYYESSMYRQPVAAVLLAPVTESIPGMQSYLDTYLAPDVRKLDLSQWLNFEIDGMSLLEQSRCMSAIGAATRSDWS